MDTGIRGKWRNLRSLPKKRRRAMLDLNYRNSIALPSLIAVDRCSRFSASHCARADQLCWTSMELMIWVRLLVLLALAGGTARMCAETEAPLTAVSAIRDLSRADAAKALPVKLTGVVVYVGWDHFVLHDGQSAVFADFRFSKAKGFWKGPLPDLSELKAGTEIEIEGVTDPGGFSPMVLLTRYQILGTKPMPAPLPTSCGDLLSSAMDSQWVEVEGVVCRYLPDSSDTGPACLTLLVNGHRYPILFRHDLNSAPEDLVDARVRVRGVVLDITNLRSEIAAVKMHGNGEMDVDILRPPPADPFMAPRVALDQLIPFSSTGDNEHRKVASGVVSFVGTRKILLPHKRQGVGESGFR